jgi:amidohydrolase
VTAAAPDELADLIEVRRDLHRHPELGYRETRTAGIAAERLRALGYEVRTGVGKTGVIGLFNGDGGDSASSARTLLLRADMDALPIEEDTSAAYKSEAPGVMHACGHDGHVAIGLGAARRLAVSPHGWRGTVKYVFQPAEEGGQGALAMIEQGLLENPRVDAAFGLHLWNDLPVGTIAAASGTVMAAVDEFEITIEGRGGHAAMPHLAADPVPCAAQVITSLQSLVSRGVDPFEPLVVSVTSLRAGEAFNVIPERAVLRGTVRTTGGRLADEIPRRFTELVSGVASAMGCRATVDYERRSPPLINEAAMAELVRSAAADVVGAKSVSDTTRSMGGEDFAFIAERVPACFAFVGSRNTAKGLDAPHHSPRFDFDEEALLIGVALAERVALRYLT